LVHSVLTKFATKSYKRFQPHVNNVSTLVYLVKLEILILHVLPLHCQRK